MVCNDPEVAGFIKQHFVAVAQDDLTYHGDAPVREVALMQKIYRQSDVDGMTQGILAATPSGRLLFHYADFRPDELLGLLERAVRDYRRMPRSDRLLAEPLKPQEGVGLPQPPPDLFDIRVTKRAMPDHGMPELDARHPRYFHFDYLWLNRDDVAALLPANREVGATRSAPRSILARFVYNNLLILEHRAWPESGIERAELKTTIVKIDGDRAQLQLQGDFHFVADNAYNRGSYRGRLLGRMTVDAEARQVLDFEAVALGDEVYLNRGGPIPAPAENVVGALFEANPGDTDSWSFPSGYPAGYESWRD